MRGLGLDGIAALLLVAVTSGGCWFHGPGEIRREISHSTGIEYSTEMGLTLGRASMAVAKFGLDVAGEDEDIRLKGVRKLQIGIYSPIGHSGEETETKRVEAESFPGWSPLVRMHDGGESVLVLVREKKAEVRDMLVIVDDRDELVVVRMKGKLNRILSEAMELGFDQAERPELYEPAVRHAERDLEPN